MRRPKSTFTLLPAAFATYVILVFITLSFLFVGPPGYSQASANQPRSSIGEFGNNTDGLIYSNYTINQLKYIVDSLNLKFKVCDLNPKYQAKLQAQGHYVYLEKGNLKAAIKDLANNISFEEFNKKYPLKEVEKNLLIVKFVAEDYINKPEIMFSSIQVGDEGGYKIGINTNKMSFVKSLKEKWVYDYDPSDKSIRAFYFTQDFKQQSLPMEYARMVQYADCMVDTTAQIFYEDAFKDRWRSTNSEPATVAQFLNYVHKKTHKPNLKGEDYEAYSQAYYAWDSTRFAVINASLANTNFFNNLLANAVTEAMENGGTNDEFEEYVSLYYSPKTALELKRKRVVIGQCSQDLSPRTHAFNIAQLSAETINWEIFLRAHLDIMNDNFERASDGSYAWERRKTYIRELEVLDINVPDLLFGISLRIENPGKNHYYGSINRLGRALAESYQATQIETRILSMIADPELDDYNRIVMYYLFLNYNSYLENSERKKDNINKLNQTVKTLLAYLATRATIKN